ncbi:hypothetical protein D3C71_1631070 [compost metagenome]
MFQHSLNHLLIGRFLRGLPVYRILEGDEDGVLGDGDGFSIDEPGMHRNLLFLDPLKHLSPHLKYLGKVAAVLTRHEFIHLRRQLRHGGDARRGGGPAVGRLGGYLTSAGNSSGLERLLQLLLQGGNLPLQRLQFASVAPGRAGRS